MPLLTEVFKINDNYSYEQAVELDDVTPNEARAEIEKHGLEWQDFLNDVGMKDVYTGEEILGWLGY